MKLGIFGGSFDPIHLGHIKIATAAYSQFALDKVIFSPLNSTWDKKTKPKASPENRVKMCSIAIEKYDFFEKTKFDECHSYAWYNKWVNTYHHF